jgi:basic amino acid/polyamine antiporter, APA family
MLTTSPAGAHRQVAVTGSDTVGAVSDRLRTVDVVAAGMLSTVGAGLFLGLAPGASLAGAWLPAALLLAAVLAGLSTVERPEPVGAWRFRVAAVADGAGVLGRVAAGAALGGAVGAYAAPLLAPLFVIGVTAFTVTGIRLPAVVTRVAAAVVLGVLAVVAGSYFAIAPEASAVAPPAEPAGVIAAAGVLFAGFVGPAVPRRRAFLVLGVVLVVSLAVAVGALRQLGAPRLALSPAPLRDALAAADAAPLTGLLTVGVVVACAFALFGALGRVRAVLAARSRHAVPGTAVAGALAAAGAILVDPVTALVAAAVLLLVEPVLRVVATGPRRAQ